MPADLAIRSATAADAAQIAEIYNPFVLTSTITFEEEPVSTEAFARRIAEVQDVGLPWRVAVRGERIVGFAYAHKWKVRAAYRFATETTIYVREGFGGAGIGSRLYEDLFIRLKAFGAHAVIGGVALPNEASIRLHEKLGFEKVAHFREVGFKLNRWIDVAYWERVL